MLPAPVRLPGHMLWHQYRTFDAIRRTRGRWMEWWGYGPQPSASTLIHAEPAVALHAYPKARGDIPIVLVPAPIKRAYIWDLAPCASVVQLCLQAGLRPYLVEWPPPGDNPPGLADYCGPLLRRCIEVALDDSKAERAFIAGHSLGGVFAAGFAARYSGLVAGLIVLASPLHFDHQTSTGALGPIVGMTDRWQLLEGSEPDLPGSLLSGASVAASPSTFSRDRLTDWLRCGEDREAATLHLKVLRWTMDEQPLSRRLLHDLVGTLYRHDALVADRLMVDGECVGAGTFTSPLLIVADQRCAIAPPASVLPFYEAAASREKKLLWYEGDVGVALQHVGVLVGRNASTVLWPQVFDWMRGLKP